MRAAIAALVCLLSAAPAFAQGRAVTPEVIETVTIHRIFNEYFSCGEHFDGELEYLGDALGTDCVIQGGLQGDSGFVTAFRNDGARNEDWYGWNAEVLAPFDGTVVAINVNPVVNQPGQLGRPPASIILFERADGVRVLFAHVQDLQVARGDTVRAGWRLRWRSPSASAAVTRPSACWRAGPANKPKAKRNLSGPPTQAGGPFVCASAAAR